MLGTAGCAPRTLMHPCFVGILIPMPDLLDSISIGTMTVPNRFVRSATHDFMPTFVWKYPPLNPSRSTFQAPLPWSRNDW